MTGLPGGPDRLTVRASGKRSACASLATSTISGAGPVARPLRYVLLAVTFLVLWFALLEQRPLWDPDEGRYAEIPREMVASGDWVTPRLDGLLYFEKPPLQYWATAAAYRLFGEANWTARLWSALTGLAGILIAFFAGARLHSARAGAYAAAILASGVLYFGMAHLNTLDAGVSVFLEAAMFSMAIGLAEKTPRESGRAWIRAAWLAMGLAVLSKGLIGLVLPALAIGAYSVLQRDASILRRLALPSGIALFLVTTAPWFVFAAMANPDFLSFFFVHEHFTRFTTTEHHRAQPWWFFFPVLALGALPWSAMMARAAWHALRERSRDRFDPFALLAVWSVFVFAFFSASGSKLMPYVLPAVPALALIGARYACVARPASLARAIFWGAAAGAAVLGVFTCVLFLRPAAFGPAPDDAAPWWYLAAFCLWVIAAAVARGWDEPGRRDLVSIVLVLALLAAHQLVFLGAQAAAPHRTTAALAAELKPRLGPATRVYVLRSYPQSLPFYLGRTVTLVEFSGELEFGLRHELGKALATLAEFRHVWSREGDAVAVMTRATLEELRAGGTSMTVIAEDAGLVAVRRP